MKNPANSSDLSSKGGWISSLSELIPWLDVRSVTSGGIFFLVGLVAALIAGWIIFPVVLYSKQPQPINFNHALHMNPEKVDGIDGETRAEKCLFCHTFREDGSFSGIPKLETCTQCHEDPDSSLGETPDEKEFLTKYVAKNQEVPWLVYSRQPDCVYFSHIAHVKMSKLDCSTCHGKHGETERLPVYQQNRLTGYSRDIWGRRISGIYFGQKPWDRMKMDDCADCHTTMGRKENNACFVCHK
ncbi:MAG: menaquinone reductase multiheme cytochrome c subunit QrcA [Pseudomonadota bacterium]